MGRRYETPTPRGCVTAEGIRKCKGNSATAAARRILQHLENYFVVHLETGIRELDLGLPDLEGATS
jgi:hypothetical protein